ncbi:hypothetical protein ACFQ36_00960 [Arthrobacter sp. GCM10027362]|uniref:GntT/GntP/DsdX family permease n=1 Tax=Arthrobacter sp. GCM10027362 TaxID=3273379 RepID=UPI00363083C0
MSMPANLKTGATVLADATTDKMLLGWIVAVLVGDCTGPATVATVTAAGILAPPASGLPPARPALTVWETIKTWSVMETVISVAGLVCVLLLSAVL